LAYKSPVKILALFVLPRNYKVSLSPPNIFVETTISPLLSVTSHPGKKGTTLIGVFEKWTLNKRMSAVYRIPNMAWT
jgi:hypothetical protein